MPSKQVRWLGLRSVLVAPGAARNLGFGLTCFLFLAVKIAVGVFKRLNYYVALGLQIRCRHPRPMRMGYATYGLHDRR